MKIIHCADIHADSKMGTHFSREQAIERRNEIVDSFISMISYAKKNDVRVIIIAGDLFDTKEAQQKSIKKRISYAISQNSEIDFLYLRGNHDEDVDFANNDNLKNLKRFSKSEWTKYTYENVDIYGHEFSNKIPLSVYNQINPDPTKINIVTVHGQVAEYKTKDGAPTISIANFVNKNIDYIALGHIHDYKVQQIDKRCSWCYSGCLSGRGFDECGEKGFVLLEINDNKVEQKFIHLESRLIHEIDVKLQGNMTYNDIMKTITSSISNISSKDIVQVNLCGDISEETEIDTESFQQSLYDNFYFIRIKDKTKPIIDYEKYEKDVSLKGEFIRLVNSKSDLSDDEKVQIIMTGVKALTGRLN